MLNVEQLITSRHQLLAPTLNGDQTLHLLLCFDDNYALPAGVAITSVIQNNRDHPIHFHLFTDNISDKNRHKLQTIDANNVAITEYVINDKFQIDSQNISQFPIAACMRLIAPIVLNDLTDRLLYIDSDTLCLKSLFVLFEVDLQDKIIAAVDDVEYMQKSQCERYQLPYGTYFNSGVMLINCDLWCKNSITERALELFNSGEKFNYPDQDVLNILVKDQHLIIDKKYNQLLALSPKGEEDSMLSNHVAIIHYITKNKPWHRPYRTRIYDKYLLLSPWYKDKLPRYENKKRSSIRQYSRLMYQQKQYLTAISYYFCYLFKKLSK